MTTSSAARGSGLTVAMRAGSASAHADAEGADFLAALLAGRVPPAGYAAYLHRLRPVYAALEAERPAEQAGDPFVAAVADPALHRLAGIDADLAHWDPHGEAADRAERTPSPAAAAYVRRVEDAAAWGGLYAAHHYTRYLGDLSGGRAIGRVLDRVYGLAGAGLAFYDFPLVPRPKRYKDAYKQRLDAVPLPVDGRERVVAEVRAAFALNRALLDELAAGAGQTSACAAR